MSKIKTEKALKVSLLSALTITFIVYLLDAGLLTTLTTIVGGAALASSIIVFISIFAVAFIGMKR